MAKRSKRDYLATLKHVIEQHVKANTRPTKVEVAEWRWLIQQAAPSSDRKI